MKAADNLIIKLMEVRDEEDHLLKKKKHDVIGNRLSFTSNSLNLLVFILF
jgi:hypothetical protein